MQFVDGLRVTADHLTHLQDRPHEGIIYLRRAVGLGRIASGLRVQAAGVPGAVTVDSVITLTVPDGAGQFRIVLRATNSDREALRVNSSSTLILLTTAAAVEPQGGADPGPDALVIAALI